MKQLHNNFNSIRVRVFILNGTPTRLFKPVPKRPQPSAQCSDTLVALAKLETRDRVRSIGERICDYRGHRFNVA